MRSILNFAVLSSCFCSALLGDATVNFPIDQPVAQTAEIYYVRSTFDRYTHIDERLETLLTLKEKESQIMNFEAFYLNVLHRYDHENDNLGVSTREHFDSRKAEDKDSNYSKSWSQISEKADFITLTSEGISATTTKVSFYTYGKSFFYKGVFGALLHLQGKQLTVEDSFIIKDGSTQWEYTITGINSRRVTYSVQVTGPVSGKGSGFWKRTNGLVGQFSLDVDSEITRITCKLSSSPQ